MALYRWKLTMEGCDTFPEPPQKVSMGLEAKEFHEVLGVGNRLFILNLNWL